MDLIKQRLNELMVSEENLWKEKKDIELDMIRNIKESRIELEKKVV